MGRYYSGDIEGKFWFAVQDSNDASFFGGEESEPQVINYYFDKDEHMEEVEEGLRQCDEALGEYGEKLDAFFDKHDMYNDRELAEALGFTVPDGRYDNPEVSKLLMWYARRILGRKIKKCLEENGSCSFEAEC